MATDSIKQGDSLFYDFECDITDIDPVWGYWSGAWSIVSVVGGVPHLTGSLMKDATPGVFQFRGGFNTINWHTLPTGNLILVAEFTNTRMGYREEQHYRFNVVRQGNF